MGSTEQTKAGNLIIGGTLRLGQFATAPSGTEGALYFNTTEKKTKVYSNSAWGDLGGGAKLALTATCSLDGDCDSTHCEDGLCCATVCSGNCNHCNVAGSIGTCIEVASDCTGNCDVCSSGNCAASNALCSTSTCTCTGSGTVFNCSSPAIGLSCGGGKVAYVDGTGLHGLIAALSDQSTSASWGCFNTAISGADGTAIGTGHQNTHDMIAAGCTNAAQVCHGVTINGYSDWYLPSKDELNQLYINRFWVGGFATLGVYRSSSEYDLWYAWFQSFNTGTQYNSSDPKDTYKYVRAVRGF